MPFKQELSQRLSSLFLDQPCWKIEPLAAEMNYSIPSVRRFLAAVGYFSSFSHNGGWYTLHSIPRFDRDGLWFYYGNIGFSRAGSLTSTLVNLTARSAMGMTAEQLGTKLRCRCHAVLVQLCRRGRLHREKIGHSHVYFSVARDIAALQRQNREGMPVAELPAQIAVLILAEFIRNPDATFEQLTGVISRDMGVTVKTAQIEALFDRHGLKKTIRTAAREP